MRTKAASVALLVLGSALFLGASAEAQLPKSGSAKLHSGWKGVGEIREVGKNHLYWGGTFYGVWFNDESRGFLHQAFWQCVYSNDISDGRASGTGFCTATDADGDQISTVPKGRGPEEGFDEIGMHSLTSGTGKYAGIQGSITWRCKFLAKHGQAACWHEANYKLP